MDFYQQQHQLLTYRVINNYGVDSMERGDYSQAIASFREANRLLKDLIGSGGHQQLPQQLPQFQPYGSSSSSMDVDSHSSSSNLFADMSRATAATASSSATSAENDVVHEHETIGYIYKHLIRIPTDLNDTLYSSGDLSQIAKEHCAAILFNLAVSHHLRGMYEMKSQDLRKAVAFYELCQKVLVRKRINCGHRIYMAIANNMGIIYTILEGETQAKPFFERLLSIQMLMIQFGNYFDTTTTEDEESMSNSNSSSSSSSADGGFLYNTSRLLILHDCAAPAA